MVVIFDLNNTLIYKEPTHNKHSDIPKYNIYIRPHLYEVLNFLNMENIKYGIWSYSRQDNFDNIINFLRKHNLEFHFTYCTHPPIPKKDLKTLEDELKISSEKMILVEDNLKKCIEGQNFYIVTKFTKDNLKTDSDLKNLLSHLKNFFKK